MMRRILTVIAADKVGQPQWIRAPKDVEVMTLFQRIIESGMQDDVASAWEPEKCRLVDWDGGELPADCRVAEVTQPGVVTLVLPSGRWPSHSASTEHWVHRQSILAHDRSRDILVRFLASPDAAIVAAKARTIDVFVSYCFEDGHLAASIVRNLEARALRVFLAESSLTIGRWREQLREAVLSSRTAVLLVTRSSLKSAWVLAEAGALASQRTPTVVLYDGVATDAIPAPLRLAEALEPAREQERWLDLVLRASQARERAQA